MATVSGSAIVVLAPGTEQMPKGQCRLCGVESALQLSHILPAFVTRWLRESSGTGKIRLGTSPNRRVQDGPRRHWLCTSCESRLSRSETSFAEKLFYPYVNGGSSHFVYGEWLLHFCVSISWRVLQHYKDESALNNYEPDVIACIAEAERTWKAFLLDQLPHPGRFPAAPLPTGWDRSNPKSIREPFSKYQSLPYAHD